MPFLKLRDRLLMAPWHGFHLVDKGRYFSTKEFSLIGLFFFYICCNLLAVQNILPRQNKFLILKQQVSNIILNFPHQFVRKHFKIFVTVIGSKFHFLLKFSTRGNQKRILLILSYGVLLSWFSM